MLPIVAIYKGRGHLGNFYHFEAHHPALLAL